MSSSSFTGQEAEGDVVVAVPRPPPTLNNIDDDNDDDDEVEFLGSRPGNPYQTNSSRRRTPPPIHNPISRASASASIFPNSTPSETPVPVPSTTSTTTTTVPTASETTKTPASTRIVNPYAKTNNNNNNTKKRPFVGGAEQARRNSRKAKKIVNPMERQRKQEQWKRQAPRLPPMERFAAALLRTRPSDLVASETPNSTRVTAQSVWTEICTRVDLQAAIPSEPLPALYTAAQARLHFAVRAALVLEEARSALAQPLLARWGHSSNPRNHNTTGTIRVTLHAMDPDPNTGHARITFQKSTPFTKDELFSIRPGSVYQCLPCDSPRQLSNVVLGFVMSSGQTRDTMDLTKRDFSLVWFRAQDDVPPSAMLVGTEWTVSPLATLISELRCFEAMTHAQILRVPFLTDLLGRSASGPHEDMPTGTHTIFDEWGDPQPHPGHTKRKKPKTITSFFQPTRSSTTTGPFALPPLNDRQAQAADTFLQSAPSTITLIQGPPGTGKTTLLVSIICRYLLEQPSAEQKRRLLVCAPTNKAVTVLATRFMAARNPDKCRFNALMVGDADKLLAEERGRYNGSHNKENRYQSQSSSSQQQLRSVFVFSWLQTVIDEYRKIATSLLSAGQTKLPGARRSNSRMSPSDLHKLACRLEKRLTSNLPDLPSNILKTAQKVSTIAGELASGKDGSKSSSLTTKLESLVAELVELQKNSKDFVCRQLIANADVLFCTLASAGGIILKHHTVNDLIVDEAAAATEPELCIPFHMQPQRMLCVGDPLQLPATVLSRRAVDLGLAESLHERLMYRCKHEYVMLDVQYRMNPEISCFPSMRFYESKINNGDNVQSPNHIGRVSLVDGSPYVFLDVDGLEEKGGGGSYRNQMEARCVVDLILQLREEAGGNGIGPWNSASRIRVITFYQAQVGLLKRMLKQHGTETGDVVVATVDSSQGCEADIVLVSFVRSNQNSVAGFLSDDRRMNVALTRAKYQLICVGNVGGLARMTVASNSSSPSTTTKGTSTLYQLAHDAWNRQVVRSQKDYKKNKKSYLLDQRLDDFYGTR